MSFFLPGPRSLAFLTVLFFAWSHTATQTTWAAPQTAFEDERTAIRSGVEMERSRRWLDAIEHYEKALKEYPENESIKYGLRRSKVHFSVDRRYTDKSFVDSLLLQSHSAAMQYVDDVLNKIRDHYVDPVSATSFIAHGTESLYHALNNPRFVEKNIPGASTDNIARLRQTLKDRYWNKTVSGVDGARHVVNEVASLAQREVQLGATPVALEYLFGGCNALDDYSTYLTPSKLEDLYGNIEGEFVGIGIEMKAEGGKGMLLVNVLPESPAEEGGAQSGDFITKIDGVDCRNMTTEQAAGLLQGQPESRVRLELTDPDTQETRTATLVRRAVKVKSIPVAQIIDHVNKIGYIKMTGFQKHTAEELDAALLKLHREDMQALIWDLRGNPGGLLTAAVEVLDRFIDNGVLVSTKGRSSDQNWQYSAQRQAKWKTPLVLLVDGDSASASEIVAGAIRDHHRGQIVGRKTYGKWSVQSILPGPGNTGMRLTTAKFYSPSGQTYGKIGVAPDIAVAESTPQHRTGYRSSKKTYDDDRDVQSGMDVLRKQLARR
jgi:carboxyl-terminal processing protease